MQIFLACKITVGLQFSVLMAGNRASADNLCITHLGFQFRSGIDFSPPVTCKFQSFLNCLRGFSRYCGINLLSLSI